MPTHLTLFCNQGSPARARAWLDENNALIEDGEDGGWNASLRTEEGTIELSFDPAYSSEPGWSRQRAGMLQYLGSFPTSKELLERVTRLVRSLSFAVGTVSEPEIDGRDTRLEIVHCLAEHMDAVIFAPGALLDARLRPLISADGEWDPESQFPAIPGEEDLEPLPEIEPPEPDPPTTERVGQRLCALLALAARGLLEMNLSMGNEPAYRLGELQAWVEALDLDDELEPDEARILSTPEGKLARQDALNGTWGFEALAVLAWALQLYELPPHDTVVEADDLLAALSFLDAPLTLSKLAGAELRTAEDLEAYNRQALFVNWRMVDFRVKPRALEDYRATIQGIFGKYFGEIDLGWTRIVDGDLAVGEVAINDADPEAVGTAQSIAVERHRGSNWLLQGGLYSDVQTNT